jgi:hypothetical protein
MRMLDHFTSLITLISLIVLGPPLGRVILRNPNGRLSGQSGLWSRSACFWPYMELSSPSDLDRLPGIRGCPTSP